MSILQTIYSKSPVSLQNVYISAYGLYWKKRRHGGVFESALYGFKERESYTYDQWQIYQTHQLRNLLTHAFNNVEFYNTLYKRHGYTNTHFNKFELSDLDKLPYLEKQDLRKFGKSKLLSSKHGLFPSFYSSSGTTGTPVQILYTYKTHQLIMAAYEARVRHWAGVDRFMPRSMIGGRRVVTEGASSGPYYRYNYAEKQLYMSAYHISQDTCHDYLEGINKYNIKYITGYAQSNFILAKYLEEKRININGIKAVITSSEKLTPNMRKTFKNVYGCKSFDGYSGVENCALITESEYGQLLISPDVGIVEILDDQFNHVDHGQTGEAFCTGFFNYEQPLIRYRIGDSLTLSKDQNTLCGRSMPVIDEISGRVEDVIEGPDGRKMVRFHGIFINLSNIVEAQVIQHKVNQFTIKVVSETGLSTVDVDTIKKRMISQLGNIDIKVVQVSEIKRNRNGKFQSVITEI